jgi:hypothetical protein
MTMGINQLSGRIILLPNARFDYTAGQIRTFVKMWNDGEADTRICEYFAISKLEVYLLVLHCANEELIEPRKGSMKGTKPHKWKRGKIIIE